MTTGCWCWCKRTTHSCLFQYVHFTVVGVWVGVGVLVCGLLLCVLMMALCDADLAILMWMAHGGKGLEFGDLGLRG